MGSGEKSAGRRGRSVESGEKREGGACDGEGGV